MTFLRALVFAGFLLWPFAGWAADDAQSRRAYDHVLIERVMVPEGGHEVMQLADVFRAELTRAFAADFVMCNEAREGAFVIQPAITAHSPDGSITTLTRLLDGRSGRVLSVVSGTQPAAEAEQWLMRWAWDLRHDADRINIDKTAAQPQTPMPTTRPTMP